MQIEALLQRLEAEAALASCDEAGQLLDCACALAFHLTCRWQSSASPASGEQKAVHEAASLQPAAEEAAAVQSLSRCISVLAKLMSSTATALGDSGINLQPTAAQIAAFLADGATDLAGQQAIWMRLYHEAAAAAGMEVQMITNEQHAVDQAPPKLSRRSSSHVVDKVRAIGPFGDLMTVPAWTTASAEQPVMHTCTLAPWMINHLLLWSGLRAWKQQHCAKNSDMILSLANCVAAAGDVAAALAA